MKFFKRLKENELRLKEVESRLSNLVECERCGCLLKKAKAHEGKKEVRENVHPAFVWDFLGRSTDYIYTPYYCKVHKPKKSK